MTDIAKTLDTAVEMIEQYGWRRGDGWVHDTNHAGNICLEGAIQLAAGIVAIPEEDEDGHQSFPNAIYEPLWNCPAYIAVHDELIEREELADMESKIWEFNDSHDAQTVIKLLKDVADKHR